LLGYVDGALNHLPKYKDIWFSENLKSMASLARASFIVGILASLASLANAYNAGATGWNLVGHVLVTIVAFTLTLLAVSFLASVGGVFFGALLGGIAASLIAMAASRFTSSYL